MVRFFDKTDAAVGLVVGRWTSRDAYTGIIRSDWTSKSKNLVDYGTARTLDELVSGQWVSLQCVLSVNRTKDLKMRIMDTLE